MDAETPGHRRAVTVDTAQRSADNQRRRELNGQPPYATLSLTQDRLNWHSTVAKVGNTFLPGQHKPNISKSQFTEVIQSKRQPFTNAFVLPTERERNALLITARRSRSVDSRYAATVGSRGDITSTLALHPMHEYFPRPVLTKKTRPTAYTEESLQAYTILAKGAVQPELPLIHEGDLVDLKEPATEESDAFMDGLFDFDRAVKDTEAVGRAKEAAAGLKSSLLASIAGGTTSNDMMAEL
ncbi:hypothetical protein DOTSEDRAFT_27129 [Dothistroma septosporum NZE10]|uniref:Uncharacterized protein n=1 Tax=Dothistroma septosporum (strain NZE10 / CBS 128990) TaxID=675120 RepID=N1PGM4_DOTSN|nr:hypothetical protein DOTSEDRAFT_27129 [Dothistroma septosporum NZE10]